MVIPSIVRRRSASKDRTGSIESAPAFDIGSRFCVGVGNGKKSWIHWADHQLHRRYFNRGGDAIRATNAVYLHYDILRGGPDITLKWRPSFEDRAAHQIFDD